MPNIKAAIKWQRQTTKRTLRNLSVRTRLKTIFKKARTAGDDAMTRMVEGEFDKAARKGIIHPNKAARKKSRLARAQRAHAAAVATAAAQPAVRRGGARKK